MKPSNTLLVTGASGKLGRQTVEFLLKKHPEAKIIATTRKPETLKDLAARGVEVRAADFNQVESLAAAFKGADRLFLISTDAIGARVAQHANAINAAKAAGVKHILYTSYPNTDHSPALVAPDHDATEKLIQKSGLSYTILRNSLYADNLLQSLVPAIAHGNIIGSAGAGKIAYVTRQDCAEAAAEALASNSTESKTLDLTGPAGVDYSELANVVSEVTGKKIGYVDLSDADFQGALEKSGLPEMWAKVCVSFDQSAKQGDVATPSNTFFSLVGRAPQDVKSFLAQNLKN